MEDLMMQLIARLPLAEASWRLWQWVMPEEDLASLYEQYRGRGYERALSLGSMVELVFDALLGHGGSGRASFERAREAGGLGVSNAAVYGKLARLPLELSQGLVAHAASRLSQVLPQGQAVVKLPKSLAGLAVIIFDGKTIKHLARRLKVLRKQQGRIIGGKLAVALWANTGLVVAMQADVDGNRNEVVLTPGLLGQAREQVPGPRLYLVDAQFCDLILPQLWRQDPGDHFVVRYSANVAFVPDPARPAQQSRDEQGRRVVDEWGWLGAASNRRRIYLRRISLHLPGRVIAVVSDLLDAAACPAADLLAVYLARWGIERVFQKVTQAFHLKRLIGSTPQATIFQAAFCLLLYDMLQVLRCYVALDAQREVETVSSQVLLVDLQRQMVTWAQLVELAPTLALLAADAPANAQQMRQRLATLLTGVWVGYWAKSPSTSHRPRKLTQPIPPGGRTSVWRALLAAGDPRATRATGPPTSD